MKQLICKKCGNERKVGRRLCGKCNSKRIAEYPRYTWTKTCAACSNIFKAWRIKQVLCKTCYDFMQKSKSEVVSTNNYAFTKKPGRTEHRDIVELVLGRKLSTNEVIHHIDDNPKNNGATNLMVLTRTIHGRLHSFLDLQRVILEKSGNENFENCWNNLIAPITTAWLETTSANVIKIWEIGQSAAEPLLNEEGSETMHEASETSNVVDEDIVQTTTTKVG